MQKKIMMLLIFFLSLQTTTMTRPSSSVSLCGGCVGFCCGLFLFRHKTVVVLVIRCSGLFVRRLRRLLLRFVFPQQTVFRSCCSVSSSLSFVLVPKSKPLFFVRNTFFFFTSLSFTSLHFTSFLVVWFVWRNTTDSRLASIV